MLNIIQQSSTELTLKDKHHLFVRIFLLFWACGFAGIPIFALLKEIAPDVGQTKLSCQRIEPAQIECVQSQSRYFGLISEQTESFQSVIQVEFNTQEILESDGDRMVKTWLSLRTDARETVLVENLYNRVSGDDFQAKNIEAIAPQLQAFMNSQDSEIAVTLEDNFGQGIGITLLLSVFPLLAALLLYYSLRSHTLILDRTRDLYTHKIHTLLGTHIKEHSLGEIQQIEVKKRRSDDGPPYGILTILLRSGKKYRLLQTFDLANADAIARHLRMFLGHSSP